MDDGGDALEHGDEGALGEEVGDDDELETALFLGGGEEGVLGEELVDVAVGADDAADGVALAEGVGEGLEADVARDAGDLGLSVSSSSDEDGGSRMNRMGR